MLSALVFSTLIALGLRLFFLLLLAALVLVVVVVFAAAVAVVVVFLVRIVKSESRTVRLIYKRNANLCFLCALCSAVPARGQFQTELIDLILLFGTELQVN